MPINSTYSQLFPVVASNFRSDIIGYGSHTKGRMCRGAIGNGKET
jgi:hypothetical protein